MILFTADWHIKLGQKNVPREWAKQRYSKFFSELKALETRADLHLIGGDLFDRLPSMEELALFFSFVVGVGIPTLIYDGNHEATRKNHTFLTYLKETVHKLNPLVWIIDEPTREERFGILPYCYLHQKDWIEQMPKEKPLFTHVRGEIPPHVKPEVDLDRFKDFPIVFAGDLHSHSNTQRNIVYPGSPMTTSFHRSEVSTGYILIDEKDWSWRWYEFDLPQLIRKTVQTEEEMVATSYHHTIYEIEGNLQDLAQVKNSELLDKKVIRKNTEASLILDDDMTIQDELSEYLQYILDLSDTQTKDIISTFNDYVKNIEME